MGAGWGVGQAHPVVGGLGKGGLHGLVPARLLTTFSLLPPPLLGRWRPGGAVSESEWPGGECTDYILQFLESCC